MKTATATLAITLILILVPPFSTPSSAETPQEKAAQPKSGWVLNAEEYFEKPGLSVLVFHDIYPEGKQGGIEIIQHGERVAALGDVRLEPAPGQWGKLPVVGKRVVDRALSRDDRYAFTGRDTGMEYAAAAALAASSRVLKGFDDRLAKECLETAVRAWEFERSHPAVRQPNPYVPERADSQEVLATAELLITTREARFAERLKSLLPVIEAQVQEVGWAAARALPHIKDAEFSKRVGSILAAYAARLKTDLAKTPYGVPFEPQIWGVTWDIQEYAVRQYFLHRAFPREFDRENLLRVLNYVLGCHPASSTSLVSAVGAQSMTVAYGINLNDWTHIPGGGVSGPSLIRPDFPELKEPFPYLWQQAEYVLTGAATYVFTVLAADRLLGETR